jgi:primosomal protein N' (replication factor Y) (superfamily II helicase)
MSQPSIVEIVLPVPFGNTFSYQLLPEHRTENLVGCRVVVPFGNQKFLTGIVTGFTDLPDETIVLRDVIEILDNKPVVTSGDIDFWFWMASYYMCTPGEVMAAALPSGMMVENRSILSIRPDYKGEHRFEGESADIFRWLMANPNAEFKEIEKGLGLKNGLKSVKILMEADAIMVDDSAQVRYAPKTETFVTINPVYADDEVMESLIESLRRAPKQEAIVLECYRLQQEFPNEKTERARLIKQFGNAPYKALTKKKVLLEHEVEISRLTEELQEVPAAILTPWQNEALQKINDEFKKQSVVLLKGPAASGKTEVYIHLIQQVIAAGKQVLYLVPEIALTTQLGKRLKRVFGNSLAIYHSRFNRNLRAEVWQKTAENNEIKVVVGARSALFVPFGNLGLIIVDEEHERSLKQQEPAPRYHARDAAIMLATRANAPVLLGSATPSVETMQNVFTGKFGMVEMTRRFGDAPEPLLQIVDLTESYKKNKLRYHFSYEMIDSITETLAKGEQIILFQNRRGFAPVVTCKSCGWVQKCRRCDVSLTWHYDKNLMGCHYCGLTQHVTNICPSCGSEAVVDKGAGTEKIEQEIRTLFPEAQVMRMDMDTAAGQRKLEAIISDFENGLVDILIGTQMIARGLDFANVGFVGVLNADNLFHFPEFRASERAWQMLTQVAGRAGRRDKQGRVIIQTHSAEHPVIRAVSGDTSTFIDNEIQERKLFKYPPFNRIIHISLRHTNNDVVLRAASEYANTLRRFLSHRVLGPESPLSNRLKGMYIQQILVKAASNNELSGIKSQLTSSLNTLIKEKKIPSSVQVIFDVDPA